MKLSELEKQHLMDLSWAPDRAQPSTEHLVELGLVVLGKGKYGSWAKITAKGTALVHSWDASEQLHLMTIDQVKEPGKTPSRSRRAASGTVIAAKDDHQLMREPEISAVKTRSRPSTMSAPVAPVPALSMPVGANRIPQPESFSLGVEDTRRPAPHKFMQEPKVRLAHKVKTRSLPSTESDPSVPALPNAVRTSTKTSCTYFPFGMFEYIHDDTKQCVVTSNKLYRSYPLGASTSDILVF